MDIWAWVQAQEQALEEAGERSLAQAMDLISRHTVNDEHAAVDALLPEALSRARSLNLPWIEVFLRHWGLQSRIFHRQDATALSEAASLVERSHREDAKDCPQSVCTVQDLAAAYGLVDGPAYAEERMAVARETLSRIDPRWPCFDCINGELASALDDADRPAEALAVVDAAVEAIRAARADRGETGMASTRIRALIRVGRLEDAQAALERDAARGRRDAFSVLRRRNQTALVACRLGRIEDALAALPTPEEIDDSPGNYREWAEAVTALVEADALTFPGPIGRALHLHAERLADGGAHRNAFDTRLCHARLSLRADQLFVAERGVERLESLLGRLVKPLGADAALAALQADGRAARAAREARRAENAVEPADTPEAALQALEALTTADEETLDRLEAAAARFPEDHRLAAWRARLWDAAGFGREALAMLQPRFEAAPPSFDLTITLGALLYGQKDDAGLAALAEHLDAAARAALAEPDGAPLEPRIASLGLWFQALRARDARNPTLAYQLANGVHESGARGQRLMTMLAELALELGRPAEALRHADELEALAPGDRDAAWLVVMAGTWVADWARVRTAGAALGMRFETEEGPIDDVWNACLVRCDVNGRQRDLYALRRGPAQAEILEILPHGARPQRGDRVVIRPAPQNAPPPEDDAEAQARHLWVYPLLGTLHAADFWGFTVDGPKPADADWQLFRDAVRDRGGDVHIHSGDRYVLRAPDAPEDAAPVRAIFARGALPAGVDAADMLARFDFCFGEGTRPFVPELAHRAGDADRARLELELGRKAGVDFES